MPVAAPVEICNLALGLLDESRIQALTDANEAARLCNLHYEPARDYVLRLHPWNFAVRRAVLAQEAVGPAFGWDYSYALPTDPYCLRVLWLGEDPVGEPQAWKVEGRSLLTDESPARLVYVGRIVDVATYDAAFVQALAHCLAWKLAKPLAGSKTEAEARREDFLATLRITRGVDGLEDVPNALPVSPFVLEQLS